LITHKRIADTTAKAETARVVADEAEATPHTALNPLLQSQEVTPRLPQSCKH